MPSSQTQGFISSWQLVSSEVCMTCFHSVSHAGTSEGSPGFSCWFALIQRHESRGFWAGPWVCGVTQWGMKAPASSASWGAVVCSGEGVPISQAMLQLQNLPSKFSVVPDVSHQCRVWQTWLLGSSYRPHSPGCSSQVEYLPALGTARLNYNPHRWFFLFFSPIGASFSCSRNSVFLVYCSSVPSSSEGFQQGRWRGMW